MHPHFLVLAGGEWSASRPCRFTPGERGPGTRWIGGWVGPRTGLDDVEKNKFLTLPGLELRPLGRPARNQSLYRLRYPGSGMASALLGGEWSALCSCRFTPAELAPGTRWMGDWVGLRTGLNDVEKR
jgi:hypothetical protein